MPSYLIKIETVDITSYIQAPGGYSVGRRELWDNANRNMAGNLKSDFVGVFPKIMLKFRPMSSSEMATISALISGSSLTVEWWDVTTGTYKSGEFYKNDHQFGVHHLELDIYEGFSLNLIAFNKLT